MDVRMPDGTVIQNVPEGTTKSQLQAKLQKFQAAQAPKPQSPLQKGYGQEWLDEMRSASQALAQPTDDIPGVGTLETAASIGTGILSPLTAAVKMPFTGRSYKEERERAVYQPRTQSGKAISGGLAAATKPVADAFSYAGDKVSDVAESVGVPKEAAQNIGAPLVDALSLTSGAKSLQKAPQKPVSVAKPKPAPIPKTDDLATAKTSLYAQADNAGVVIKPESTAKSAAIFRQVAEKENLGKLTPKLSEAVSILDERVAQSRPLTLSDADKVRQLIGDAMKSADAGDRRMARLVKTKYDNYLDNLGPQDTLAGNAEQAVAVLKSARDMNRRFENSKLIDSMVKKAHRDGDAKFTQAGEEHALRTEFKKLASNERKMRTFSAEERQAIEAVSRGGNTKGQRFVANTARNIGKFDPTAGGMASFVSLGTGALMSNPLLPAAGYASKKLATKLTKANVEKAREALVGRGMEMPPPILKSAAPKPAGLSELEQILFSDMLRRQQAADQIRRSNPNL